ncbi:DegT/DnrJ/EryC1/StrS family aminotransferase [Elusimicrobiota bacterium]
MAYVREAFASNWIAPAGPHIEAFERELAGRVGVRHAVALSSGTAALHLAMRALGLRRGEEVLCSTLNFAACANAILYEGARPFFVDSNTSTWNMDPNLLEMELSRRARRGRLPKAVIVVDLYGQCADWDPIQKLCRRYEVPVIDDAAEALGATYKGRSAGSFGLAGILSFNGNKIITTSGGGMLVTGNASLAKRARHLSQQARDSAPHYQHSQIGYNYRMSNVLAGIGRGQIQVLDKRVAARRRNYSFYRKALGDLPGIRFMPEASYGRATRWLTCLLIEPSALGATRNRMRRHLESLNIESRPAWKPLHLQPVYSGCGVRGGEVAEEIFSKGLCLPSGSSLSQADLRRVVKGFRSVPRS